MPGDCWAGAVLAGGASRRMGSDKAALELGGEPLVARLAGFLRAAGAEAVVAVGGDSSLHARAGVDSLPDEHPGQGPLGGLLSALHWSPCPVLVVVAVDLVRLDAETVSRVVAALRRPADVAAAQGGDRREPLCAAWRVQRCEPTLAAAFSSGERAIRRAWSGLQVVSVGVDPSRLVNANSPGDLGGG